MKTKLRVTPLSEQLKKRDSLCWTRRLVRHRSSADGPGC